jgi:hypothetical protein
LKFKLIILLIIGILLTGCVKTTSIYGRIKDLEDNTFFVGCTEQVRKSERNIEVEDIELLCKVLLTDKTTFKNEDGETLSAKDLTNDSEVAVILTEPTKISNSQSNREVIATEIILMNKK